MENRDHAGQGGRPALPHQPPHDESLQRAPYGVQYGQHQVSAGGKRMCRIFCTCMAMHDAMTDSARIGSQELSGTPPHRRTAPQPWVFSQHRQQSVSFRSIDAYRAIVYSQPQSRGPLSGEQWASYVRELYHQRVAASAGRNLSGSHPSCPVKAYPVCECAHASR